MFSDSWPSVRIIDETMREGMQIESAAISTSDKVRLLDALSSTGLSTVVVGSFVSPRWVPQMSDIDDVVGRFTPRHGVEYRALALNPKGVERRAAHEPPLTPLVGSERHSLRTHLSETFLLRNTNQTAEQERSRWDDVLQRARDEGATHGGLSINAAWGCNWEGRFSLDQRLDALADQAKAWDDLGVIVDRVWLGDPMGWNSPEAVGETLVAVLERHPDIRHVHLHLHNTRGLAFVSVYEALRTLRPEHELIIDSSLGGIGGCPYCGNGRATGMIATEDLVHFLHAHGRDTGVDLDALVEAGTLASQIVGRRLDSHVTRAGPFPSEGTRYPHDLPLVEDFDEALHFRSGLRVTRRPR
jgi:hydroxymethylglutaryl-CoA lyase